ALFLRQRIAVGPTLEEGQRRLAAGQLIPSQWGLREHAVVFVTSVYEAGLGGRADERDRAPVSGLPQRCCNRPAAAGRVPDPRRPVLPIDAGQYLGTLVDVSGRRPHLAEAGGRRLRSGSTPPCQPCLAYNCANSGPLCAEAAS